MTLGEAVFGRNKKGAKTSFQLKKVGEFFPKPGLATR